MLRKAEGVFRTSSSPMYKLVLESGQKLRSKKSLASVRDSYQDERKRVPPAPGGRLVSFVMSFLPKCGC